MYYSYCRDFVGIGDDDVDGSGCRDKCSDYEDDCGGGDDNDDAGADGVYDGDENVNRCDNYDDSGGDDIADDENSDD